MCAPVGVPTPVLPRPLIRRSLSIRPWTAARQPRSFSYAETRRLGKLSALAHIAYGGGSARGAMQQKPLNLLPALPPSTSTQKRKLCKMLHSFWCWALTPCSSRGHTWALCSAQSPWACRRRRPLCRLPGRAPPPCPRPCSAHAGRKPPRATPATHQLLLLSPCKYAASRWPAMSHAMLHIGTDHHASSDGRRHCVWDRAIALTITGSRASSVIP